MDLSKLPDVMTPQQLADFFLITPYMVRAAVKKGSLKATRVGKLYRIEKKDVEKWLEESSAKE